MKCFKILFFVLLISVSALCAEDKLIFNTQEFSPFSYSQNGVASGPGVDIVNLIGKNIGVKTEVKVLPWTRAQAEAKDGLANGLFFVGKNKEREAWLNFSTPVVDTEYGFFVLKENETKFSPDFKELDNKVVAVYGPSNTATSLQDFIKTRQGIKMDESIDDIAAFRKLSGGRCEAVYSNKDVGIAIIKQLSLNNVKYAGKQKGLVYYISLTKKTDPTLTKKFETELANIKQNGTLLKILTKYHMEMSK